ncbi:hypothetical protein T484DRAFT_1822446 [Baffinella frigidus]|nr:hypothetical protein T484DRAFT_1822446 [Cryptophyta sp. CCMP2293]
MDLGRDPGWVGAGARESSRGAQEEWDMINQVWKARARQAWAAEDAERMDVDNLLQILRANWVNFFTGRAAPSKEDRVRLALLLFDRCDQMPDGTLSLDDILEWYTQTVENWPNTGGYQLRDAGPNPDFQWTPTLLMAKPIFDGLATDQTGTVEAEQLLQVTEMVWEHGREGGGGESISDAEYVKLTDDLLRARRRELKASLAS